MAGWGSVVAFYANISVICLELTSLYCLMARHHGLPSDTTAWKQ